MCVLQCSCSGHTDYAFVRLGALVKLLVVIVVGDVRAYSYVSLATVQFWVSTSRAAMHASRQVGWWIAHRLTRV